MSVRNYRLYFAGQLISTTGTWMQSIAQAWLVLQITGSGVALGLTVALQFLPVLLVGAWAVSSPTASTSGVSSSARRPPRACSPSSWGPSPPSASSSSG